MRLAGIFREYGRLGQNRYLGTFFEEFLPELRGKKGIKVYREMSDNDDIIGAIMFALEMLMRQATWSVAPGGPTAADQRAAEFVDSCRDDMQQTWTETISEVLSFLNYGWSWHEIVYKRRTGSRRDPKLNSKFDDGLIGWRKMPIRSQDTLWEWSYSPDDDLLGMIQAAPPTFEHVLIPSEKSLHFTTKSVKGNPEGRSILRNAYRAWYFKKRIQEFEGIGIERDLAGFPVLTSPEGVNLFDSEDPDMQKLRRMAECIVSNVKRDAVEGLVLPFGWDFKLLGSGGQRQFDTCKIIERYDQRMAMTVLADFILLGHEKVGSFALSSDKTELFGVAIGSFLDIICEVFNSQAIPPLINLNGTAFDGLTGYPRLEHGDIETPDLSVLGKFITDMSGIGAIMPDDALEGYLRRVANLPERQEDSEPRAPHAQNMDADVEDEEADGQIAAQARKRLGRDVY